MKGSDLRRLLGDLALPGTGRLLDGQHLLGFLVLLPAATVLVAVGLSMTRLEGGARVAALGWCLVAWALLASAANAGGWRREALRKFDPAVVRRLHRETVAAWLRDDPAALPAARRLVEAAPALPGAWRLLARVAGDRGEVRLARRADRRADRLQDLP